MTRVPDAAPETAASSARPSPARVLVALILCQICRHSTMAGVRMAAPLWVLRQRHAEWAIGVSVGWFAAAPIVVALQAGRLAERCDYHRPLYVAVALTTAGGALALGSTWAAPRDSTPQCVAASRALEALRT